ncbi:MAG: hypothetical protein CVV10_01140 [Gammaproteobacteria bacterium HGW-Gammaproteobacteria-14]|nr:MAG: hypothetical protein CVV10_01140 [Gammaproteobacteria bacterium HGW-Gammaproteobacteria-14]
MIYRAVIAFIFCICSSTALSAELADGKTYRLTVTAEVKKVGDTNTIYTAMKNNKFEVISKKSNGDYIVRFDRIYTSTSAHLVNSNWVKWGEMYVLPTNLGSSVEVTKVAKESLTGLSAGPLIVPFKYRTGNDSLAGDATIGMYAGLTFEPGCTKSNWCFRFTPLVSAGISQVSVASGEGTESKTSATWAAGFLITNWADLNIGVVYGQDRIGDKEWEHEGEGWWSVMIGWEL